MEESIYYKMYQEEMETIEPCTMEEQQRLISLLLQGDEKAANRLMEGNLFRVVSIAKNYEGKGVRIEDLIAEGNLALTLAVGMYEQGDFVSFIESAIESAMEAIVEEEKDYGETGVNLAALLNVMDEVSTRLAAEYGREATVSEIAEKMRMDEEQIKELMKMALSAVSVSVPQEEQEEMYLDEDMVSDNDSILEETENMDDMDI